MSDDSLIPLTVYGLRFVINGLYLSSLKYDVIKNAAPQLRLNLIRHASFTPFSFSQMTSLM